MNNSFIVILTCSFFILSSVGGNEVQQRLIGGRRAKRGQFPSTVSIRNGAKSHLCGGNLITTQCVLTAAHCVTDVDLDPYTIYTGSNNLLKGGEFYNISHAVFHTHFNKMSLENDVAILRTTVPVTLNKYTKLAKLPPLTFSVPVRARVTVAGWGLTRYWPKQKSSPFLRFVRNRVVDNEKCKYTNHNAHNETNYCAVGSFGKDVCLGDSGGPLVYKRYLVGTLVVGPACASNKPSVYIKLTAYLDWIEHVTSSLEAMIENQG